MANSFRKISISTYLTAEGYTVLGWNALKPAENLQVLLNRYYTAQLNQQEFSQLRHQLSQKLNSILEKLRQKARTFEERLQQSDRADRYRQQADLLMAHLHEWQPGMKLITLADFDSGEPVAIALEPEKMRSKMPKVFTNALPSSNVPVRQ